MKIKKLSLTALLLSFSLVVSILEGFIPVQSFIPLPGVKLGLANISVMAALVYAGRASAFAIAVLRPLIMLLLFGNPASFILSLSGGLLATVCAIITVRMYNRVCSFVGISALCAVAHSIGQLAAAGIILSFSVLWYLPALVIGSSLTGALTGLIMNYIFTRVKL